MTATNPATTCKKTVADLAYEAELFNAGYRLVAGIDEVGRGSLAGPVSVGVAVITPDTRLQVDGLTDSKALTGSSRQKMVPQIRQWCTSTVGHVSPAEIDTLGMTLSLRLAAQRALAKLTNHRIRPDAVLLDGKHDWLSATEPHLLTTLDKQHMRYDELVQNVWQAAGAAQWYGHVCTVIKGDYQCASIAAASVIAKVERDRIMTELAADNPDYSWEHNKGYGSAAHRTAITQHGPSPLHRLTWALQASDEQIQAAYNRREAENGGNKHER